MSIAINPMPAASSPDDGAARSAAMHDGNSILPFESILDDQSTADEGTDSATVGDVDLPLDAPETVLAPQAALDSLAALLGASISGTRPLLRKDDFNQSVAAESIKKDKPVVDPGSLFLLAAQDVVRPLDVPQAPPATEIKDTGAANAPIRSSNNDEMVQHLFAALTEIEARAVLNADTDDSPLTTTATSLTDLLIKASDPNTQSDQTYLPDLPIARTPATPSSPATATLVDAIRLTIGQAAQLDQDKGFTQSSTAGFDRRGSKTAVVPAIHVTEAGSFDAAVRTSAAPGEPTVTLPNEDGVVSSLVQSMRLQMRDGVGTAVVHLEPDYLGPVSISLRVENGVVTASLHAENPQVRAWMEANTPLLRESMAGQGLSLDRLLVTDERIADEQSQGRRQQHEQDQQARQRPRRNDATTFEVVV